ncbi:MAG TPA: YetF domain-containing protein [Bacillota bacterium]|nr:YetF domain-containing protein [Bacillota bacterium]
MSDLLGLYMEPKELGILQVCLRAVIVFLVALVIVRVADKRFLAKMTAFDALLGFVLASALARAINGSAPLFPTLIMGFLLVGLHRLLALVAMRWHWFGVLVKGHEEVLIENGRINEKAMRTNSISEKDLLEAAREAGKVDSLKDIQKAVMERSGKISVIPAKNGT